MLPIAAFAYNGADSHAGRPVADLEATFAFGSVGAGTGGEGCGLNPETGCGPGWLILLAVVGFHRLYARA
jgi:hypothetical protein